MTTLEPTVATTHPSHLLFARFTNCQQVVFCGKYEKHRTPLLERGQTLHKVLWDARYGRTAHSSASLVV